MVGIANVVKRFTVLGWLVLLALAQMPYPGACKEVDADALGPRVAYDELGASIRVAALEEAFLSAENLDQMVRARERNAAWLVCDRRTNYRAFSYTLDIVHANGEVSSYPVVGRYDRGLFLSLPSEFVLYYGDCSRYEYRTSGEFFVVQTKPSVVRDQSFMDPYGLPRYVAWLSPFWATRPSAWLGTLDLRKFVLQPSLVPFSYGYQLWFSTDDYRLVKEVVTQPVPRTSSGYDAQAGYDYSEEETFAEAVYDYEDSPFPRKVQLSFAEGVEANLQFEMVKGFWVFREGTVSSTRGERIKEWSLRCHAVSVQQ